MNSDGKRRCGDGFRALQQMPLDTSSAAAAALVSLLCTAAKEVSSTQQRHLAEFSFTIRSAPSFNAAAMKTLFLHSKMKTFLKLIDNFLCAIFGQVSWVTFGKSGVI